MELAQELVVTGVVAVLVSFLIAKLVSMVMAGDSPKDSELTTTASDHNLGCDVNEEVVVEELRFGERLEARGFVGEKRTEPVHEADAGARMVVDAFVGEAGPVHESEKSAFCGGVAEIKCSQLADDSIENSGSKKEEKEEEEEQEKSLDEMSAMKVEFSATEENRVVGGDKEVAEKVEEKVDSKEENEVLTGVELAVESSGMAEKSEEISAVESELKEDVDKKEIEIESEEDDDWEGIERSELEKLFAEAAKFVESGDGDGRLASFGTDAQNELYGLHKLVTEGPCREQPPMALKVAARAKWNAWQRLGNMSPEVAMEQYIGLVSDRVPGWMEDKSTGDGNLGSSVTTIPKAAAPDISTLSSNQQDIKTERNQEPRSGAESGDSTEGSSLEKQVKE